MTKPQFAIFNSVFKSNPNPRITHMRTIKLS